MTDIVNKFVNYEFVDIGLGTAHLLGEIAFNAVNKAVLAWISPPPSSSGTWLGGLGRTQCGSVIG